MGFSVGDWHVSGERNEIACGNVTRRLEPRVMDLLKYLARHPGEVLTHDEIIRNVWPHSYVSDSALQTAVSALRKAFGDDFRQPGVLETIPKRGYRLVAPSSAAKPVVVVLPFENLTGNPQLEYLADGVAELLIAELGREPGLRVISRHSSMAFKNRDALLPGIAARLSADYAVEGSVLMDGKDLCTTVQLIDASADTHCWSDTIRTSVGGMLRSLRAAAGTIADKLCAETRQFDSAPEPIVDTEAMTCYLRGRFHFYKLSPEHFPSALENLQKAVTIEPGFAAAHAAIADVWGGFGYWGAIPAREAEREIRSALAKAEAADPEDAETNMMFGALHLFVEYDWTAARWRLDRAVRINPNLAGAYLLRALFLGTLREATALDAADRGKRLDPLNPAILFARSLVLTGAERFDEASRELDEIFEIAPDFKPAVEMAAELALIAGDEDAIEWERRHWADDDAISNILADAAARRRLPETMRQISELLRQRATSDYVSPRILARQYCLAGDYETAMSILERGIAERDLMQIDFVQMAPAFAALRDSAAYRELLKSIDLF